MTSDDIASMEVGDMLVSNPGTPPRHVGLITKIIDDSLHYNAGDHNVRVVELIDENLVSIVTAFDVNSMYPNWELVKKGNDA